MCRALAYLGPPTLVDELLYQPEVSLVRQATDSRLMQLLNLGGFGMAAWAPGSADADRPFVYRTPGVPMFDRNLKALALKIRANALVAHVRGVIYEPSERVGLQNVHPFLFEGAAFALAQNGDLFDFGRMRYDLLEHIPAGLVARIEGTTDTEWFYALCLAQLDDPFAVCDADQMADALLAALRIIGDARDRRSIDTQSPINIFLTDGRSLVATRYVFDYGWYPEDGSFFAGERENDFTTLWYLAGSGKLGATGEWEMRPGERPTALIVASEPLASDTSTWLPVPEYAMLVTRRNEDHLDLEVRELAL